MEPWSRVIVYCRKLSFCQNDSPIGEKIIENAVPRFIFFLISWMFFPWPLNIFHPSCLILSAHSYIVLLLTISAIYMSLQSLKFLHHCILVITPWSAYWFLNLVWTRKYLSFKTKTDYELFSFLVHFSKNVQYELCRVSRLEMIHFKGQFGNQDWPLKS